VWEPVSDLMIEVKAQPISLNAESRVKGICQLMDCEILEIRATPITSEEDVDFMIKQFDQVLDSLDRYLSMANSFLRKYREQNKIGEPEMKKSMLIIRKKRREVIKIIIGDYEALGLPEVKECVSKRKRV